MNSKIILIVLFLTLGLSGACSGYYESHHRATPKAFDILFLAVSTVLVYRWYYLDAAARAYRRTALLGGAVIMLPLLALPYYLFRSRPTGQKMRALLGYFGLLVLAIVTIVLGGLPFALADVATTPR
ncbi:hypothetical protein [Ideonella paludis]|uniref:Uncharacterized protein n=1 Tax=Ideonella paludis TaxID=1233411 RepID=A0ABS5E0I0_9BURK|nr:hypothetical protein [Ideonella paludis]MBQ0936898.1 hypothetical protein [Ideonella paludis]